jgi:hypothetical protein
MCMNDFVTVYASMFLDVSVYECAYLYMLYENYRKQLHLTKLK